MISRNYKRESFNLIIFASLTSIRFSLRSRNDRSPEPPSIGSESRCFSFSCGRTDVVCCLLYETSVLSRGATELQAAKTLRNPCERRNNTPFDMRSGNTAKENKCFHCSEQDGEFLPLCYMCSWFDSQDEPRPLSLIDFRCQRQANNGGSIGIYQEVLQGCSWAFLLQVFSFLSSLSLSRSLFFSSSSSLRPPPFHTRELQTPRVNIIALKLKAPTSSPHSLALVRLVALSHNLAQFDRYIGAVLCHG